MASNNSHPFFDPLWRRVLLVVACTVWAAVELVTESYMWASLVGALTVYAAYSYLYAYTPSSAAKPPTIES